MTMDYYFIILLIYIISTYLFSRLRIVWNFATMVMGTIFFLNNWNSTVVSDSIMKLSFMLSFLLYCMTVYYNVYISEDEK